MEINPTIVSYSGIKEYLISFVKDKPNYVKWKDFYESSTGMLFIELLSTLGAYVGYQSLITRRESYSPTAKLKSSGIGIAGTLGYPVYRGRNEHITITITPTSTIILDKYSVIGSCADKDLININPINLVYGEEISFEVVIGDLKEEENKLSSADTKIIRFYSPNVSEDYILLLDDEEVPTAKEILKLLNDYYVVLTNSLNSVDILYLNRPQPYTWVGNIPYNNNQFVKPDFRRRNNTFYNINDKVIPIISNGKYYEAITAGNSGASSPIWKELVDSLTIDNEITWKCLGEAPIKLYFRNDSPGQSYSGNVEPIWPMTQGKQVVDNEITWTCTKDMSYSLYQYDTGSVLKVKYIELSETIYTESDIDLFYGALLSSKVANKYSPSETLDSIKINAPLYHETKHIVKGREDYRKLFKELLPNAIDTNGHDVSPAIVELTYAKDHVTTLWETKLYIAAGSMILPSIPNGFIYRSNIEGYTASGTVGKSGETEPIWPSIIGEKVIDNEIIWVCETAMASGTAWTASTAFNINAKIVADNYQYIIDSISVEPIWPTIIGETVADNEIIWECIDTHYILGYDAVTWEVNSTISIGDFILPIVPIKYFYIAKTSGITGAIEPNWPTVIGETIEDNEVIWETYDLIEAEKYQKNNVLKELSDYRVFGVMPPTIKDPIFVYVKLKIVLYCLKQTTVLLSQIKVDVDDILYTYEKALGISMEVNDIEALCEKLNYVKVARIEVIQETKSKSWETGKVYRKRAVVYPTAANNLCYECYYIRDAKDYGESQGTTKAYTFGEEPIWPTVVGETVRDNHIIWECTELSGIPTVWQRNTLYEINSTIIPSIENGFMYTFTFIEDLEPIWPTLIGDSIVDHEIYWVTRDPISFSPSLDWNEYYILGREIEVVL